MPHCGNGAKVPPDLIHISGNCSPHPCVDPDTDVNIAGGEAVG